MTRTAFTFAIAAALLCGTALAALLVPFEEMNEVSKHIRRSGVTRTLVDYDANGRDLQRTIPRAHALSAARDTLIDSKPITIIPAWRPGLLRLTRCHDGLPCRGIYFVCTISGFFSGV